MQIVKMSRTSVSMYSAVYTSLSLFDYNEVWRRKNIAGAILSNCQTECILRQYIGLDEDELAIRLTTDIRINCHRNNKIKKIITLWTAHGVFG